MTKRGIIPSADSQYMSRFDDQTITDFSQRNCTINLSGGTPTAVSASGTPFSYGRQFAPPKYLYTTETFQYQRLTARFWMKLPNKLDAKVVIQTYDWNGTLNSCGWQVYYNNADDTMNFNATHTIAGGTGYAVWEATALPVSTVPANEWMYVVATFDGTSRNLHVFSESGGHLSISSVAGSSSVVYIAVAGYHFLTMNTYYQRWATSFSAPAGTGYDVADFEIQDVAIPIWEIENIWKAVSNPVVGFKP